MVNASVVAANACAWPVLTRLGPGRFGVVYFDRPAHGTVEGDLAAKMSVDDGRTWTEHGKPAPHLPGGNRMHIAAGLDHDGCWGVLSTGFEVSDGRIVRLQNVWFSRLHGSGTFWKVDCAARVELPAKHCIPHGRILAIPDGRLAATFYRSGGRGAPSHTWIAFSSDMGLSWGDARLIGDGDTNEAVVLRRSDGALLSVVRTHRDHHLDLFVSEDSGDTWRLQGPLTLPMQHPGDLTDLGERRILLTYGIRNRGLMGIGARLSKDDGASWGAPAVIYQFGDATDCGYPSTVLCDDGSLLTACYSDVSTVSAGGYHMLMLRWSLADFFDPKALRSISDGRPLEA